MNTTTTATVPPERQLAHKALTIDAGIEYARRSTHLHSPPAKNPDQRMAPWAPRHTCPQCSGAGGGKGLQDHCRSAGHVAHEYGLGANMAPYLEAIAKTLHTAKLSYRLPDHIGDLHLKGYIEKSLEQSWRKLYGTAKPDTMRSLIDLKRVAPNIEICDVFIKRITRNGVPARHLPAPHVGNGAKPSMARRPA